MLALKRGSENRFNPGYMKNRVHPTKRGRQLEQYRNRIKDLGDLVGTNEPRR